MKVYPSQKSIDGVPDYYQIYLKLMKNYEKSQNQKDLTLAMHYARVAEEMGQVLIYEDEEKTLEL